MSRLANFLHSVSLCVGNKFQNAYLVKVCPLFFGIGLCLPPPPSFRWLSYKAHKNWEIPFGWGTSGSHQRLSWSRPASWLEVIRGLFGSSIWPRRNSYVFRLLPDRLLVMGKKHDRISLDLRKIGRKRIRIKNRQPEPIDSIPAARQVGHIDRWPIPLLAAILTSIYVFFRSWGYHFQVSNVRYPTNHRCFALYVFLCLRRRKLEEQITWTR